MGRLGNNLRLDLTNVDGKTISDALQLIAQDPSNRRLKTLRAWEIKEPQPNKVKELAHWENRERGTTGNNPTPTFTPFIIQEVTSRHGPMGTPPPHQKGSYILSNQQAFDEGREILERVANNQPKIPFMGSGKIAHTRLIAAYAYQGFTQSGSNGAFQTYGEYSNQILDLKGITESAHMNNKTNRGRNKVLKAINELFYNEEEREIQGR